MHTNLAQLLTDTAAKHGARSALKFDDHVITYEMLNEGAARVAGLLKQRGVAPGDRVGIMLPNVPYFVTVYYGILRAGGVVVPMNVLFKRREVRFYLADSQAKQLFVWHDFAESGQAGAAEAGTEVITVAPGEFERLLATAPREVADAPRDPSDTAVILYTSGTTGTPKGAELTHDNMLENCLRGGTNLIDVSEQDVVLGALPLFHSFGQTCCMNAGIREGACMTLMPRFDAEKALEIVERDKVTILDGVPTMFHALLNHPEREKYDVSSVRVCCSGGSAMPVEVMRGFERAFGCVILEGYGLSETSPVASFNHVDRERKPGSIGTPIHGVEMKVVDDQDNELPPGEVGEIVIRGHNVMKGYHNRPDATAEAMKGGWFHTGDLARVDEDGYFFIVDRKKDMIIRGGYNVYPREIEEVLYEHPAVLEAAIIGVPDASLGEEIAACVVLRPGADPSTDDIRNFVKDRVAAYKYPRHIWFTDELPKGATGKVLKRDIPVPDFAHAASGSRQEETVTTKR
ncbi:MAG TPA: long-chain fatty acid--CoA ligase [Solirubrobacteraceae bacterium]|nr:long-chain fatty acid--CoA ligase [Solirubrobacteraceae bacterium]